MACWYVLLRWSGLRAYSTCKNGGRRTQEMRETHARNEGGARSMVPQYAALG